MREILFRGKSREDGEWVEGHYVKAKDTDSDELKHIIITELYIHSDGRMQVADYAEVDTETLGQYTGMTDKNGKKIFEGDILKKINPVPIETVDIYRVEWCVDCGLYELVNITIKGVARSFRTHYGFQFEIIGNIYDNPEMLGDADA